MFKTHYSFRHAVGSPDEVCAKIKAMGYEYAPIADVASTFGWLPWRDACEKHGLKPVYGVALNVTPNVEAKKPIVDLWSFYAIDRIAPVNRLVTLATSQFRYTPLLSYEQAMAAKDVLRVTGYKPRLELIEPEPNLYVGDYPASNRKCLDRAIERGFSILPMNNAVYVDKGDQGLYELACGRNATTQTYRQWIR